MISWSDEDLRCSLDEGEKHLPRSEDGAAEEPSPARLLLAIYSEGERERDWGFWESLRKEKAKKAQADGETIVPME